MSHCSRRALLSAAAFGSAAALVPAAAHSAPVAFDETFDVVVVGSGVAGTVAAIAAAENGSRVLLIEKMNRLGGTSRFSGLNFACVNSPAQKKKGIEDSPEALARDMYKVSGDLGNYELALNMARNTARAERFLTQRGVKWDGRLLKLGGHSAARCLIPEGDGAGLLSRLWEHMKTLKNLEVRLNCRADEVLFDEKRTVIGLGVRSDYRFNYELENDDVNTSGRRVNIRVRQGVVFATGGYARDKAFRSAEVPFLAGVSTTTSEGATSAALKTLVAAGARPMHLSLFRFAYPLPTEDMVWGMMIDPATGRRFMSEGEGRNALAVGSLTLQLRNGGRKPFMIYDEKGLGKFHNLNRVGRSLNGLNGIDGTMYKFDSLAALCAHFGADESVVADSLKTYNEGVKNGKDAFGKPLERSARPVEPISSSGPFYGIVISPRLNYTPGGIRINTKAQALDWNNEPIAGLFVAGEAAGGMHGTERMTACSMPDCTVYGLIAGEEVSRLPKKA